MLLELGLTYFFVAIKVLIMAVGLLGNLLIIVVIVNTKRLHTRVYALLVNLAVADLLSLVICVPHNILQEFKSVYKPDLLCKLTYGFEHTFTMASSLTIVVIALERLIVIWLPLRGPSLLGRTSLRAAVMLGLWLLSTLVTLPFFINASRLSVPLRDGLGNVTGWAHVCQLPRSLTLPYANISNASTSASTSTSTSTSASASTSTSTSASILGLAPETYYIVSTCLELYLPMLLIVMLYVAIFYKLLRSFRRLGGGKDQHQRQHQQQQLELQQLHQHQHQHHRGHHRCRVNTSALMERKRVVYFSVLVATVYFLTVAPFCSLALCMAYGGCFHQLRSALGDGGLFALLHSLVALLYTNHCLNPVLYNLASRRFRRATTSFLGAVVLRRCRGPTTTMAARNGCGAVAMDTRTVRATTRQRTRLKSRTNNCDLAV